MPRSLTIPAIRDSQRENAYDVFLILLDIDTQIAGPDRYIYLVNNTENIVAFGRTYIACPFKLALPDSTDSTTDTAELTLDNVDTRIWQGLRQMQEAAWMTLSVILASDPNTVVLQTTNLRLRGADATNSEIAAKMVVDSIWNMGFPAHDFDPPQNPGMFTT